MKQREQVASILTEWQGKVITMPDVSVLPVLNSQSVDSQRGEYRIVNYVDSIGCLSCNLRFREWNIYIKELHDKDVKISPIFIFSSKNKKIIKEIYALAMQNWAIRLEKDIVDLGAFHWTEEQTSEVSIANTGTSPLIILDVITSCGCITVEYPKEPILPKEEKSLKINYKADHLGHFSKTITI